MTPRASIVVPLLQQIPAWLEKAVESALTQTVPCDVVTVTSPHTPEDNREVLRRLAAVYPQLRIVEREPGMRFAAALNLGFRSAICERAGLLLTDDWLDPRTVECCLRFDADIVSTGRTFFDKDGAVLNELKRNHSLREFARLRTQPERANYLGHFFLFRRAALFAAGGVDETVGDSPGVDDFHLIWTMLDHGATVALVEQPLYNYRDHAGERLTTRKKEEMVATFARILGKHGITGAEHDKMMREHSRWFGVPILARHREMCGTAVPVPSHLEAVRSLYRRALPQAARIAIHRRLLQPLLDACKR